MIVTTGYLPIVLIIIDLAAAVEYCLYSNWRLAVYWVAAAILTACVTFK